METVQKLMAFLEKSPTSFHAVRALKQALLAAGFTELSESAPWNLTPGSGYYVIRDESSILSFRIPEETPKRFHIIAAHSDSPCFKLKTGPCVSGGYVQLNVEKYGSPIVHTWFDRPLTLAGRVLVDRGDHIESVPVHWDEDLLRIPSLAIHLGGGKLSDPISIQKELSPILGLGEDTSLLTERICQAVGAEPEAILGGDLFLVSHEKPLLWGADQEFLSAPRLDDLACAYPSFLGLLDSAVPTETVPVHCVFDHEEIGSETRQGAGSSFLGDTLERICLCLGMSREQYFMAVAERRMISADNAHACHPNYPEKSDPNVRPILNGGVVIKYQAGKRYATDGPSEAFFKKLCGDHSIPYQTFVNHADIPGGSTLGHIASARVPLCTVDIGLPQLAMHSACETCGVQDPDHLLSLSRAFFQDQ